MSTPAAREAVFQRGLEAYRRGQFYEAHEHWEDIWKGEDDQDHRRFLQGLIQVASALHKVLNHVAPRGAPRLLDRALARTEGLPEVYGGIALARFREAVARCRPEVERLVAEGRSDLDPTLIPTIETASDALPWRERSPEPSPDAQAELRLGVAAYHGRRYYEAHEHWEVIWRDEQRPMMKAFLQGLILVAAALHKLEKMRSPSGALRLLESAHARLAEVPEGTCGMAIGLLRADIDRARAEIARLAAEGGVDLAPMFVPRMEAWGKTLPS